MVECEDSESEESEPMTKVTFNNIVQVVEYSCPTESSRVETEIELTSDNESEESQLEVCAEFDFNQRFYPHPEINISKESSGSAYQNK
jgi:hypothetical protein